MGADSSTEQKEEKSNLAIPSQYLCALTNTIMSNPMMAITTGKVYEHLAIQKWIEYGQNVDPTNGIPLCIQQSKDAAFEFRDDLRTKINEYLNTNPEHKPLQSTNDINWDTLFKDKLEHIYWLKKEYKRQQKQMTRQAQILFSKQRITPGINDNNLLLNNPIHKLDFHNVPLRSDIPIITFTGPSRTGKSTLLNDILSVPNAFKVSSSPNIQCTKGAWIAYYKSNNKLNNVNGICAPDIASDEELPIVSQTKGVILNNEFPDDVLKQLKQFGYSKKQILTAMDTVQNKNNINHILDVMDKQEELKQDVGYSSSDIRHFYMIDMEGLTHGLSDFTKKLFYACYAMSNVIVWNDKQIGSDSFKHFMEYLAKDMKCVVMSKRKPCLLYLQRDADEFIDFGEYKTLDGYLKNDKSFDWLRDMNIFSCIYGYQIKRRPKTDDINIGFDKECIQKLVDFILNLIFLSERFVENGYDMRQQVENINERNSINLGLELVFANEILRGLVMDKGVRDNGNLRRSQIVQYAEKYKWDVNKIEMEFNKADEMLVKKLMEQGLIDEEFRNVLIKNKKDVIERINEKKTNDIIKITLLLTSPITVPLAIMFGLASAIVIGPYLAGSAIYERFVQSDNNDDEKKDDK